MLAQVAVPELEAECHGDVLAVVGVESAARGVLACYGAHKLLGPPQPREVAASLFHAYLAERHAVDVYQREHVLAVAQVPQHVAWGVVEVHDAAVVHAGREPRYGLGQRHVHLGCGMGYLVQAVRIVALHAHEERERHEPVLMLLYVGHRLGRVEALGREPPGVAVGPHALGRAQPE